MDALRGSVVRLTLTFAGLAPGRLNLADRDAWGTSAFSALLHVLALASFSWVFFASGGAADEDIARDRIGEMRALLAAADAHAVESVESEADSRTAQRPDAGGAAQSAAPLDRGAAGSVRSRDARHVVAGATDDTARASREDSVRLAASFGVLGLLPTAMTRGPDGVFARDASPGSGNMWGDEIGDVLGVGGLGLTGIGEGGGGRRRDFGGRGLAARDVRWALRGPPGGRLRARERAARSGAHRGLADAAVPPGSGGAIAVHGHRERRLPPEVVQRVVRQSEGRFRFCYEQGLAKNPSLAGRVKVKFVIGRDGAVSVAQDAGSDVPDATVVSCMVRAVGALSFPQPEGGIVSVVYPWVLAPTS